MKQVFINALILIDRRIKSCGRALSKSLDAETNQYWTKELALAQVQHRKVMKRSKLQHNVVHVDFVNKRRAA